MRIKGSHIVLSAALSAATIANELRSYKASLDMTADRQTTNKVRSNDREDTISPARNLPAVENQEIAPAENALRQSYYCADDSNFTELQGPDKKIWEPVEIVADEESSDSVEAQTNAPTNEQLYQPSDQSPPSALARFIIEHPHITGAAIGGVLVAMMRQRQIARNAKKK